MSRFYLAVDIIDHIIVQLIAGDYEHSQDKQYGGDHGHKPQSARQS